MFQGRARANVAAEISEVTSEGGNFGCENTILFSFLYPLVCVGAKQKSKQKQMKSIGFVFKNGDLESQHHLEIESMVENSGNICDPPVENGNLEARKFVHMIAAPPDDEGIHSSENLDTARRNTKKLAKKCRNTKLMRTK